MPSYKFGDVVLIKFPFTNNQSFKKRPALIINDTNDGDVIVCRITSTLHKSLYDIELKSWHLYGLKLPSVIRVHKIASLKARIKFDVSALFPTKNFIPPFFPFRNAI